MSGFFFFLFICPGSKLAAAKRAFFFFLFRRISRKEAFAISQEKEEEVAEDGRLQHIGVYAYIILW